MACTVQDHKHPEPITAPNNVQVEEYINTNVQYFTALPWPCARSSALLQRQQLMNNNYWPLQTLRPYPRSHLSQKAPCIDRAISALQSARGGGPGAVPRPLESRRRLRQRCSWRRLRAWKLTACADRQAHKNALFSSVRLRMEPIDFCQLRQL